MSYQYTEKQLNEFHCSYMGTAIWSSATNDSENETPQIHDDSDISPEAIDAMLEHCKAFLSKHGALIESEPEVKLTNDGGTRWGLAGHDFWLTRNGHGAGFWDGDWPVNGDALSEACDWQGEFGEVDLYAGDDGLVYIG